MKTPVTLIIMDGFGLTEEKAGNAILAAGTPNIDQLWESSPHCRLAASGPDVGLPPDTMGNSEVGHTNIGAGRVVYQSLLRISNSIEDGSFFANPVLASAAVQCAATDSAAHIFVLLSDIGVHSDIHHVWALLKLLKDKGVKRAYLHCFMDGRDASPQSGRGYVEEAMRQCAAIGLGQVASLCGRFYAMDRDKRWERVQKAYENLVAGTGKACADPLQAMEESYAAGITDEFVEPVICCPEGLIRAGDSIFFMNFRPDRAREITRAFCDPAFDGFPRINGYFPVDFVCLAQYDADLPNVRVAFPPEEPKNTLGEYLSRLGMTQLRIAETEKYAHVTFFFNGGRETVFENEERILVNSPKVPTYDLLPQMSAPEVAEKLIAQIRTGKQDMIILNFANGDMVGHTGIYTSITQAVTCIDRLVGQVVEEAIAKDYVVLLTADHGNADFAVNPDGSPNTAHSLNTVQFVVINAGEQVKSVKDGALCNVAPTILKLMGIPQPAAMTAEPLI